MRTMFILRGAPGAGKSTLIRRHRLGDLAIGLDDFRRLYSTPFTDLDGVPTLSMTFGAEKQVVTAFRAAVANRIRQGGTLLLDCTNPTRKSYREFASLARRCGYEVRVIDVQGELDDAELVERNESRRGEIGYVEPRVVTDIAARVRAGADSVVEPVVGMDDVRRLSTVEEIDATGYERLVVIGDVQSCSGALARVKEHFGGWDPATLFVFVGDLFDPLIAAAAAAQPEELPPLERAVRGLLAALDDPAAEAELGSQEFRERIELIAATDSLRSAAWASGQATRDAIREALTTQDTRPREACVAAGAVIGAATSLLLAWADEPADEPAIQALREGLELLLGEAR